MSESKDKERRKRREVGNSVLVNGSGNERCKVKKRALFIASPPLSPFHNYPSSSTTTMKCTRPFFPPVEREETKTVVLQLTFDRLRRTECEHTGPDN